MPKAFYRRQLPHLQRHGKPHFLTFCTNHRWILPEAIRSIVLECCLHDEGIKTNVQVVVVMPDHVHMIFTPLVNHRAMEVYSLAEITDAIKGASAHKVNQAMERHGQVWQPDPSITYCDHRKVCCTRCSTCSRIRCAKAWPPGGKVIPGSGRSRSQTLMLSRAPGRLALKNAFDSVTLIPRKCARLSSSGWDHPPKTSSLSRSILMQPGASVFPQTQARLMRSSFSGGTARTRLDPVWRTPADRRVIAIDCHCRE